MMGCGLNDFYFGALVAEGVDFFNWSGGRREDEEIVGRGANKL